LLAAVAAVDHLDWLRVEYAQHNLLRDQVAYAAIKAGAVASVRWLAAAGFAYTDVKYTARASASKQFEMLRYFIDASCPWDRLLARRQAAACGDAAVLEWLRVTDQELWSTAVLTQLLLEAAVSDNLTTAKWLRAQGAEWPQSFLITRDAELQQAAGLRFMQWALANGCPWGAWNCRTCIEVCSQASTLSSQAKQDAITWAHAAGCACDFWLHRFAAWLQHGRKAIRDVNMPKSRCWHAPLFRLYTHAGICLLFAVLAVSSAILQDADSKIQQSVLGHKQWQHQRHQIERWSAAGTVGASRDEKIHRVLLDLELCNARRYWPDDALLQTRLIREYLQCTGNANCFDKVLSVAIRTGREESLPTPPMLHKVVQGIVVIVMGAHAASMWVCVLMAVLHGLFWLCPPSTG
jgi:hypothetical protein